MYRHLDADKTIVTLEALNSRIAERFPGAGLSRVCSELCKVGALYAQNFKDTVVLSAVNELESLTTGLSRKIWQKIMILHKLDERIPPADRTP